MMEKTKALGRSFILRALVAALCLVMLSVTALAVDVSTWADIVDAVTNGGSNVELTLQKDIQAEGVVDVKETVTVNFNGHQLKLASGHQSAFNRYMSGRLYYQIGSEKDLTYSLVDPSVSTIQLTKDIQINTNNLSINDLSKVDLNGYTIAPSQSWMNMTVRVDTEAELRKALETGATSIVLDANINLASELVTGNAGKINLNGYSISGADIVAEVDTYQELRDAMNNSLVGEVRMTTDIKVNENFTITDLDKLNLNGNTLGRSADWQNITANVTNESELRKALDMGGVTKVALQNDITLSSELVTDNAAAISTGSYTLGGADVVATVDTWNAFKSAYASGVVDTVRLTADVNTNGEWYTLGSGLSKVELGGHQINGSNLTINVYNEGDLAKALRQPALNSAAVKGEVTVSSEIEADYSAANRVNVSGGSLSFTGSGKLIATVSTEQELKNALNHAGISHAKLENDIQMSGNLSVNNTDAILLNGYKLIFAEGNGIAQNVGTEKDFLDALKNPDVSKIQLTDDITITADLLIENMPEIIKNNHDILLGSGVDVTVNVDKWSELKAAVELGLPGLQIALYNTITAPSSNGTLNVRTDTNIDLRGQNVNTGSSTLFHVANGAELTVRDTGYGQRRATQDNSQDVYKDSYLIDTADGRKGLVYYVTHSDIINASVGGATYNNAATRETRTRYELTGYSLVNAEKSNNPIFNVESGATLNIQGGAYYGSDNRAISSNGTVNLSGDTVFAGNSAASGGAVAVNGGTLTIAAKRNGSGWWDPGETHGVVMTGNTSTGTGRDGGGALYVGANGTVVMNGGYITNNHSVSTSYETSGGGVAVRGKMTMNGGYITANQASAGGGLSTWYWEGGEFYMDGGFVAGNVATTYEGGGVVINFKGYGEITGGYITNNKTLTKQHWGGGGIFVSDFGVLRMESVLIVDNEAGGFGGGLAGCSTGRIDTHDTTNSLDHTVGLFGNTAAGTNLSGSESSKDIDRLYAATDPVFMRDNGAHFQDYFSALSSRICGGMLANGTANWSGTIDGQAINRGDIGKDDVVVGQSITGLTSHASGRDRQNAAARATRSGVVVSGNYSYTHGGGILCDGYLVIGTQDEITVGDRMDLRGSKSAEGIEYDADDPFTFTVIQDANKNDAADRGEKAVLSGEAKENSEIIFNSRLSFDKPGTYHYLISEDRGDRAGITYDETVYKLVVTVSSTTQTVDNLDGRYPTQAENLTVTFNKITNVKVYKKEAGASGFSLEMDEDVNSEDREAYRLGYGLDFVNEMEGSDLGGLKVSKTVVSALASDLKREFTFTVELNDDTISGKHGDVTFESGKATFTLTHEGTAVISGLPVGVGYTVSETPVDGFTTSIEGSVEANIVKNAQPMVAFTNTKDTGDLSVTKTLSDNKATGDEEFTIVVTLDDNGITGTFGDMAFAAGKATLTLKADETKTATGLPVGVGYTVEEQNAEGYTVTYTGETGTISTAKAEAVVANAKEYAEGGLTLKKSVAGHAPANKAYSFTLTLSDDSISGTYGDAAFWNGTASVQLKAGETAEITGLPAGVVVSIAEAELGEGWSTQVKVGEAAPVVSIDAEVTIVKDGMQTVEFINSYAAEGGVTFSGTKVLEGRELKAGEFTFELYDNEGNLIEAVTNAADGSFAFTTLKYDLADDGETYTYTYKVSEKAGEIPGMTYDDTVHTVTVEIADNGDGTMKVTPSENADELSFYNSYETGDLTVSKTVSANPVNPDAQFRFTVTLSDAAINGEFGEMTFTNGVATFVLKDGETKTATGLPAGVAYEVTEAPANGYISTSEGAAGTISSDPANVQFINTKNEGSLTLTKKVTGTGADEDLEFEFTITLFNSNKGITADYNAVLTDGANQIPALVKFVDGSVVVRLKHNQSLTINGIPTGLQYTVTEKAAEGYVSSLESVNGQAASNAGAISATPAAVTFINRRVSGGLTLTKKVVGTVIDRAETNVFTFLIKLDDESVEGEYAAQTSTAGRAETKVTFTRGEAEVQLAPGESMTIEGLPTGVGYTVSELLDEEGQKKYNVTYTGETGEISETVPSVSEITNTRKFGGLKVNKIVASNPVDTATEFAFKVTISEPINGMFGGMNFASGVAEFVLSHGESMEAEHLPAGATYKVEETDAKGYVSTSEGVLEAEIAENVTPEVTFTNTKETGAIELKKSVSSANAPEQTFAFALELSDKTITAQYSGVSFTNGAAAVTLKAGESLKIEGLPVSLGVKIAETSAGAGWSTSVKVGSGDAAAAMEANVTVVKNETQVVEFINSYAANGEVTFGGMKTIEGRDLKEKEFTFELRDEAGSVIETVQNAADGSIAFSAIKYDLDDAGKTFKYTVSEVKGVLPGVTYDETVYTVEVNVVDNGDGMLTATASENAQSLNFRNGYEAEGKANFGGVKLLEGRDLKEKEFTFELRDEAGNVLQTVTNAADGSFAFEALEYELEDAGKTYTYTYKVSEQAGDIPGMTYDETVHTVTVEVSDNGDGTLNVKVSENAQSLTFINKYAADGEVTFGGMKTIEGRDLKEKEFTFELRDEAGSVIETVQNAADGSIAFSAIKYDLDDAGKTFKYTVSEVKGALPGVTYDETVYTVEVKVVDNGDGTLTATASENAQSLNFRNGYEAEGKVNFGGVKLLEGRDLKEKEFTFELRDEAGNVLQTVTNAADGSFAFEALEYELEDEGKTYTYTYRVSEQAGDIPGMTYDETVHTVTVEVSDNGDGTLNVKVSENAQSLSFINKYAADGEVTFGGMKTMEGRALAEGEFTFELKDAEGNVLQTVTNAADGTIAFAPIGYQLSDAGKTYTYTVSEKNDGKSGVTYDETVHTVTVEVSDNGDGTLNVKVSENAQSLTFTNKYAADGEVTFGGMKTMEGRALAEGEFTFELKDAEGNVLQTVTNAADGTIAFAPIGYQLSDAGKTYTYTVSEKNDGKSGVTYDETIHTVTVSVADNGSGKLSVTASENAQSLSFTNKALFGKLKISKSVTGEGADKTKSFGFAVGLTDEAGQPVTATYIGIFFNGSESIPAQVNVTGGVVEIGLTDGQWLEIEGIPVGYGYTVTEHDADGYVTTSTGEAGVITEGTAQAQFVNQYLSGGLMVTKSVVSAKEEDKTRKFGFTVELGDETINGTYGQMTFENGVAVFQLGDGEAIYATGLPQGVAYSVEEEETEGFTAQVVSGQTSGVIAAGEPRIAFVNTREEIEEFGNLSVKKTITGSAADKTKKFTFRVTLGDTSISGVYGGMTFRNGVATFQLGDGDVLTATGLPAGVSYTVRELDSADYVVTCTYETGTITAKKTMTASFINHREKGDLPETGDDSAMGLYAAMLAMSSAVLAVMARRKRRA